MTGFDAADFFKQQTVNRKKSGFRASLNKGCTVKLGNKERFDKEQIGIKEPFPVTNLPFTS